MALINESYITIQGWMASKLKLKSNELLVYALIYGFSQDGRSDFTGSLNYISEWLNCSKPTVIKALDGLNKKGLIEKKQEFVNKVKVNRYFAVIPVPDIEDASPKEKDDKKQEEPQLPVVYQMPLSDGTSYPITQQKIDEWWDAYPRVDIHLAIRQMIAWSNSHLPKRKTKRGVQGFITGWLARDQDYGKNVRNSGSSRVWGGGEQSGADNNSPWNAGTV